MKVTLVNPRSKNPQEIQQKCFPPVSLMYLASSLRRAGHGVDIIDANAFGLTDTEIIDAIKISKPDLIGISLMSEILHSVYRLTGRMKDSYPAGEIVLGGPHAEALPERVLEEFRACDYLLSGEAEESIVALCGTLEEKIDPDGIKGLSYRRGGRVFNNGAKGLIEDIDRLEPPARDLLEMAYREKRYHIILVRERPVDTIITSRGCPFRCKFCCNTEARYRALSPEKVLEEILSVYSKGIRNIDIADANFTFDRERAAGIFDLIKREKIKVSFRIKSRTDSIDEELVWKAKEAGAYLISLGMESGSQDMLDRMAKGTRLEDNARACGMVMKAGLKLNTGWILGFPGETRETVEDTVRSITEIKPTTANINALVPYPGTEVYEEAKREGSLMGDWSVECKDTPWVRLPWIDSYGGLSNLVRWARKKVYYRPYYVYNFAKEIACGANLPLARYALQESIKSFKGQSA